MTPSIYVQASHRQIRYWDYFDPCLRSVRLAELPAECLEAMRQASFQPGIFIVPVAVFYADRSPWQNVAEWAKYKTATYLNGQWAEIAGAFADPYFDRCRRVVEPGGESYITQTRETRSDGVILDLEWKGSGGLRQRYQVIHAAAWLAAGTIHYDRERHCWRSDRPLDSMRARTLAAALWPPLN
jgi:hypothetical protein